MVDYALNGNFDVYFNEWNDLKTVDGKEEFEQDVVVTLHDEMDDIIQYGFTDTARQKIKLAINRTAESYGVIDSIRDVVITKSIDKPYTFEVEIVYSVGDTFTETF